MNQATLTGGRILVEDLKFFSKGGAIIDAIEWMHPLPRKQK